MSWEDVAIVKEEDMEASFAFAMKIRFIDEEIPSAIASSDDSCSSENSTESSCCEEESAFDAAPVSEFTDVRLSKGGHNVQFSTVHVREYSVTIGDHPNVEMYPLSLDWAYAEGETHSMDEFESRSRSTTPEHQKQQQQQQRWKQRRGIKAPRLTATERMARLVDVTGCSNQALFQQERKRQLLVQEEKFLAEIRADEMRTLYSM